MLRQSPIIVAGAMLVSISAAHAHSPGAVSVVPPLPPGYNPTTAGAGLNARYAVPPEPDAAAAPRAHAAWTRAMHSSGRRASATITPTKRRHTPIANKHAVAESNGIIAEIGTASPCGMDAGDALIRSARERHDHADETSPYPDCEQTCSRRVQRHHRRDRHREPMRHGRGRCTHPVGARAPRSRRRNVAIPRLRTNMQSQSPTASSPRSAPRAHAAWTRAMHSSGRRASATITPTKRRHTPIANKHAVAESNGIIAEIGTASPCGMDAGDALIRSARERHDHADETSPYPDCEQTCSRRVQRHHR